MRCPPEPGGPCSFPSEMWALQFCCSTPFGKPIQAKKPSPLPHVGPPPEFGPRPTFDWSYIVGKMAPVLHHEGMSTHEVFLCALKSSAPSSRPHCPAQGP